jgi:hypothetical protein
LPFRPLRPKTKRAPKAWPSGAFGAPALFAPGHLNPKAQSPVSDKSVISWPNFAVSVLGGVAAAVIFAVVVRGGIGGLLLAHLAPLPIMIVAFAFGLIHGATAAILASVILSFWPNPVIGMAYALLIAAPAWSAAYAASGAPRSGRDRLTSNLPGWAALAPAIFLATAIIFWLIVASVIFGSLDEALNPIRARVFILLDLMVKERDLGDKIDPTALSGSVARAIPAFLAGYGLLIHVVNLWLAARIAEASKLLGRPWPDIAREFRVPKAVGDRAHLLRRRRGTDRIGARDDHGTASRLPGTGRRAYFPARFALERPCPCDYLFHARLPGLADPHFHRARISRPHLQLSGPTGRRRAGRDAKTGLTFARFFST